MKINIEGNSIDLSNVLDSKKSIETLIKFLIKQHEELTGLKAVTIATVEGGVCSIDVAPSWASWEIVDYDDLELAIDGMLTRNKDVLGITHWRYNRMNEAVQSIRDRFGIEQVKITGSLDEAICHAINLYFGGERL